MAITKRRNCRRLPSSRTTMMTPLVALILLKMTVVTRDYSMMNMNPITVTVTVTTKATKTIHQIMIQQRWQHYKNNII